jgi:DNA-binding response OmpR family regulator
MESWHRPLTGIDSGDGGDKMADDAFAPTETPRGRRALVVDDEPAIRRLVSRALGTQDIEVDGARDGDEGLRRAGTMAYDVILLDLHLPELDGMVVLHRLLSREPGQAVVVFSCQSDPATRRRCLRAGARAFLAKPFSLVDLCASVSAACAGAAGSPEQPARSSPVAGYRASVLRR